MDLFPQYLMTYNHQSARPCNEDRRDSTAMFTGAVVVAWCILCIVLTFVVSDILLWLFGLLNRMLKIDCLVPWNLMP